MKERRAEKNDAPGLRQKRSFVGHPVLCDLQFYTEPCAFITHSSQKFSLKYKHKPQDEGLLTETLEKLEMLQTVKTRYYRRSLVVK